MKKKYKQTISREGSVIGFQALNLGDTIELKKWIDQSFAIHYFVNKKGVINLFYEKKEGDKVYDAIKDKLKEEGFFDSLCNNFLDNVNKGKEIIKKEYLSKEEIIQMYKIMIKCWPFVTVVDIMSNYLEIIPDNNIKQKMIQIRTENGEFMYDAENKMDKSIRNIFPELKEYYGVITMKEFIEEKFPSKEELEKRYNHYILFDNILETDKSFSEISREQDFEIIEKEINEKIEGMVVSKGNAKGRVKIIFKEEDLDKVNEGDVLVSPMTTPDHIVAMEKASAFVTDEGGLLCHAAIVSREMNKPCIVGTKNATKVLKDNDLVFVDCEKGIVEKID